MKRTLLGFVILFGFVTWVGCTTEDSVTPAALRQAIIDGVPDTDPAHMAVVAIWDEAALCSGTLIAPRVVLTAGHCLYRRDGTRFQAIFGNETQAAPMRKVIAARLHPEYEPYSLINDIALLYLAEPAPDGILPIPALPAGLSLTHDDVGGPLVFSGFGRNELGQFTRKLTVTGVLGFVCDDEGSCSGLGRPAAVNTICYDQELGGPCFGDSGGPAFVTRDGVEYVAGITSYGDWRCAEYGCSTQVDRFDEFIQSFLNATKGQGAACADAAECLSNHCADGVCCDYACERPCEHCALDGSMGQCRRVEDDSIEEGCGLDEGCATAAGKPSAWIFTLLFVFILGFLPFLRRDQ